MEPWVQEVLLPIVLPAIAALYSGLAGIWGWPYDKAIQLIRERRCARDSENGKCSGTGSNRRNRTGRLYRGDKYFACNIAKAVWRVY